MSRRAVRLTADQAIKILTRLGFVQVHQSGSHRIFRDPKGVRATIPYHKGRILHPKIVAIMIRDTGLTPDQFAALL